MYGCMDVCMHACMYACMYIIIRIFIEMRALPLAHSAPFWYNWICEVSWSKPPVASKDMGSEEILRDSLRSLDGIMGISMGI
jgi:hypothetical protein